MITLAKQAYCTGCTACASACPKNCITMDIDGEGFRVPVIHTEKCVQCGLCVKSCPIVTPHPLTSERAIQVHAAYSTDNSVRMGSSSGGIFTEIALHILQNGGVVFGAAFSDTFAIKHICIDNAKDLFRLRGAKYAQSDLSGIFLDISKRLEEKQQVLFSGTPCQVVGLKHYLGKDYDNLLTVDFVCHSIPSPMAWQEYVRYRAKKDNGGTFPLSINLRSKATGWSRYQYSNLFEYANENRHSVKSGDSLFMKLFVGGYISRQSCENCQFKGYRRASDLTLGDFWGIWNIDPDFDDNKGVSLLLIQSDRGEKLLSEVKHRLILRKASLEEASRENPAILQQISSSSKRAKALALIKKGNFKSCEKFFRKNRLHRLKSILRGFLKK